MLAFYEMIGEIFHLQIFANIYTTTLCDVIADDRLVDDI